jgi:hypothetical protein
MSDEENEQEKKDKGSYAASVITTTENLKKPSEYKEFKELYKKIKDDKTILEQT